MLIRIIIDLLIVGGLVFAVAGTIGILKMPDPFSRMQAATCISTMGVLGVALGGILYTIFVMHNSAAAIKIVAIALMILATNPVGSHVIAKGAYSHGYRPKRKWIQTIWGGISMSNAMIFLDLLIVCGLVVSAILAVHFEKLLSAVISLGATGLFAAAAFLLMHAPDVAISEAAVGAALTPLIFIVALIKIRGGDDK